MMHTYSKEQIEKIIEDIKGDPDYMNMPAMVPAIIRYYEAKMEAFAEYVVDRIPQTRAITYIWPDLPPEGLRGNARIHHQVKAKLVKKHRYSGGENGLVIRSELQALGITEPMDYARITYCFHKSQPERADVNNFVGGMKAFQDGLVDAGVFVDDASGHLLEGAHSIVSGTERTVITIEALG